MDPENGTATTNGRGGAVTEEQPLLPSPLSQQQQQRLQQQPSREESWRMSSRSALDESSTTATTSLHGATTTTRTNARASRTRNNSSSTSSRSGSNGTTADAVKDLANRFFLSGYYTTSERAKSLAQNPGLGAAALLIRDAVLGEVENPSRGAYDPYRRSPERTVQNAVSVVCHRLCANRTLLRCLYGTAWILVLITFVEPPYWCRNHPAAEYYEDAVGADALTSRADPSYFSNCQILLPLRGIPAGSSSDSDSDNAGNQKHVEYYPNTNSMVLTMHQSRVAETICVILLSVFILLRVGRDGLSLTCYLRPSTARSNRIIQLVCLALLIAGLSSGYTAHHPYVRLFFLGSLLLDMQKDIAVLIRVIPDAMQILAVLFVLMLFYAWFGTVMFLQTDEGKAHFSSLIEALWTLWICVTTANYPDVMMPSYNENRWTALYFVSFMAISFFFLMNVVLAGVVNEYDTATEQRKRDRQNERTEGLRKAFRLMDPRSTGRISRRTVMALFCILNEDFPEFRTLSEDDTLLLFAVLDRDGSSTITLDEFLDLGNVMMLEFVKVGEYKTMVEARFPAIYRSVWYQNFCQAVKSSTFEAVIDIMLILNAVVIAVQNYPELSGQEVHLDPKYWDGSIDTEWELIELIFAFIYGLECTVKVLVYGWKRYLENSKNVFDLVITLMAFAASAIVYYPNRISDSRLIRMVVMARVLRLLRLLMATKHFRLIGRVSAEILPAATSVVLVLFCLTYLFATLGMHLYGGLVTRDPNNPNAALILNTDFSNNEYWANNFNDMVGSMNCLFNLLVVNNWPQLEAGFEAVTRAKWVRLYFVTFHVLGVILVNNLVIAFIINNFLQQLALHRRDLDRRAEVVGDGQAILRDHRAEFDATEITGTKTMLSGGYIARLRKAHSDVTSDATVHDRLRELFTQTSGDNDEGRRSRTGDTVATTIRSERSLE